jgi:YVTN family beta-propeller protein
MSKEQDLERWVVYVANPTTLGVQAAPRSSVAMLDARDLSILRSARLGPGATRLALSPDGNRLWVSHPLQGANQISVLDTATLDVIEVIDLESAATITPLDHRPYGIAARPASPSILGPGEDQALVVYGNRDMVGVYNIMGKTSSLLRTIPVSVRAPRIIVLTPDGRKAYVMTYGSRLEVAVIRCADSTEVRTVDCVGGPTGHRLQEAVVSPDGTTIYVTNQTAHQIEVISTSDDEVLDPIPTDPYPRAIGISPDGAYLFVGHVGQTEGAPGSIKMLRLSRTPTGVVAQVVASKPIPVDHPPATTGNPRTIAVTPTGGRIFVAEHDSDECYAFDVNYRDRSSLTGVGLSHVAVVDLNIIEPKYTAKPVELVVGQRLTPP